MLYLLRKMSVLIRTKNSCLVYFLRHTLCLPILQFSSTTNQEFSTENYLIHSCGLSANEALASSKKCTLKRTVNADSVLAFLTSHGFTKIQIRELISRYPKLLQGSVEKNLQPKIQFFLDFGLSATQLVKLVVSYPYILKVGLKSRLVPSFNFRKELLHINEKVIKALRQSSWFINRNFVSIIPNISLLEELGIPISNIARLLMDHPRRVAVNTYRFSELVTRVKELGFDPCSPSMFTEAICAVGMSPSTWETKFTVYRRFGWSDKDVLFAFWRRPCCMMVSEKKTERWMDFFLNKLGLKPSDIISPQFSSLQLGASDHPQMYSYANSCIQQSDSEGSHSMPVAAGHPNG